MRVGQVDVGEAELPLWLRLPAGVACSVTAPVGIAAAAMIGASLVPVMVTLTVW